MKSAMLCVVGAWALAWGGAALVWADDTSDVTSPTELTAAVEQAMVHLQRVQGHYENNEFDAMQAAALAGLEAMGEGDQHSKLRGSFWYWLGVSSDQRGDHALALEQFTRALEFQKIGGNRREVGVCLNSIANVHGALGQPMQQLEALLAAQDIFDELGKAEREQALLDLRIRIEAAEKEREIEHLKRAGVENELALTRAAAERDAARQARETAQAQGRTTLAIALGVGVAALILAGLLRVTRQSERRLTRQQKQIEEALAGQRAAHAELKKLYDRKSEWLGFAVHDLRSPLFAIDAVCDEIEGGLIASPIEGVAEIRVAAARMRQELEAWLQAEREDRTQVTVHPVSADLARISNEVVVLNQPAARAKSITLQHVVSGPVPARVDPWRWSEVVDNLVSNAIKYSPAGSRVDVVSGLANRRAFVRVSDQGPGVSDEDRDHLFKAYASLSAQPTGGETSTGLGLHLAKRIVDAHGGTVTVDNAPGGGAIFEVSVPMDA